jgi:hypothetical protein
VRGVILGFGSSGRIRTYNPSVNASRLMLKKKGLMFALHWDGLPRNHFFPHTLLYSPFLSPRAKEIAKVDSSQTGVVDGV